MHFEFIPDTLIVINNENRLFVSLLCPSFRIGDRVYGNALKSLALRGDFARGEPVEITFEPLLASDETSLEVRLFIQWFPGEKVLRKWAKIKRNASSEPTTLNEVILDCLTLPDDSGLEFYPQPSYGIKPGQSYPAFFKGFFAGIEYPASSTRLVDGKLILAHRPGLALIAGQEYETRKVVYGVCPEGFEKSMFFDYLAAQRTASQGFHINYNNWWTSPIQYTENDILGLMQTLKEALYDKHGVSFDSYCFDMGWSNGRSIWEIDTQLFPNGFSRLSTFADSMGSSLGLWTSPGGCYDPALNHQWAKAQGYEAAISMMAEFDNLKIPYLCLAGEKYRNEFLKNIVTLVETYKIKQVKLDGLVFECQEEDHGHEPGVFSSEAIAAGTIAVLDAIRKAMPEVWLEATCFGWNPSPWWLFYVDSTIGAYGTDAPYGRIPCPVFRESYTTARDFFNLQGAARLPIPVSAQEVLGIIHQTPDCFMNDAVMTILRGQSFLPIYLNPKYMNNARWERFAGILKWARAHSSIVKKTDALLPEAWQDGHCPVLTNEAAMPREPYGYAHWNIEDGKSLVVLRNPWIKPCSYSLKLPISLSESASDNKLEVVSLYPEARSYGQGLAPGDGTDILLAPYETVVLSVGKEQRVSAAGLETGEKKPYLKVNLVEYTFLKESKPGFPPGDSEVDDANSGDFKLEISINIEVQAPHVDILVVMEGESALPQCSSGVMIDGIESTLLCSRSEDGWTASTLLPIEHWLILHAPIPDGEHSIQISTAFSHSVKKLSAWAWASRPGQMLDLGDSDLLPQPERISLDAVILIEPLKIWQSRAKN